jgi:uncharacterized repeat protein (TIGR01451 family)
MRTIRILSVLLAFATVAVAAESSSLPNPQAILCNAEVSSGRTILTVRDDSEQPFSTPVARLVVLPAEGTPRVRLLSTDDGDDPAIDVTAGKPMILRGLRVLPVMIAARTGDLAKSGEAMPHMLEIDVRCDGDASSATAASPALLHSRGFFRPLAGMIAPEQLAMIPSESEGTYLIVTDPQFLAAVEPLAAWKRAKGLDVVVVTTETTGRQNTQVRDYISSLYHSENPPQYVLLVGDTPDASLNGVPSFDFAGTVSDLPYTLMDGDDFLPDLMVGRLSASTLEQAQTIVAKILRYEQNPYTDEGTAWFQRGLVVAADYASSTPRPVARWCREQLLDIGYASVDSVYFPPHWGTGTILIPRSINAGVSIVAYRGWAYGIYGWEPPHFTNTEIAGLTNGWKTPVVFSFVCQNNDFRNPENPCFGEEWIRAGTPTQPRGAVAFVGNSEPWSHTRFNDAAAIGAFEAMSGGMRRLGDILLSFKMEWLTQFPSEIPFSGDGKESVEYYFYIYNLLGDPEMEMWMAPPTPISVAYANPIPLGGNFLDVSVTNSGEPVAGVRVGLSQDGVSIGTGWTDASGIAHVPASFAEVGEVVVTVTGEGVAPYGGTADVQAGLPFLSVNATALDDDNQGASSGNSDQVANPDETIELLVTVRNQGSTAATGVHGTLSPADGFTVLTGEVAFPDIAPGATATNATPFVVRVDPGAENGRVGHLRIDAGAGSSHSVSDLVISVVAADLLPEEIRIEGDGVLDPGEEDAMGIFFRNVGGMPTGAMSVVLHTSTPELVTLADSTGDLASIPAGETGGDAGAFRVKAADEAAIGRIALFRATMTCADGQIIETAFPLTIGKVDHSAPLGPDAYGYYAYDVTDTDYPAAVPTFDYVTCSTQYGGAGTKLPLVDNQIATVDLPFSFTYYGTAHDRIAVSDNGWVSFDTSNYYDWYNWHMPNVYGNGSQIAPFWDNLDPTKKIYGSSSNPIPIADGVYTLYDEVNHRFIVEWSRMPNYNPNFNELQTFELILEDPEFHPTGSGNGTFLFQYKQITNNDTDRMFATVGIENATEDVGLEYSYSNLYPTAAAPIGSGLAIRFSTDPPRYDPPSLRSFSAQSVGSSVTLTWEPSDERPRSGYRVYRGPVDGGGYALVSETLQSASARSFVDTKADPAASYAYRIGSVDPFGRETVIGPYLYLSREASGLALSLEARTPNPFKGTVDLTYALPRRGAVELRIHDLAGRLVRTLRSGPADAGLWTASWDGKDEAGHDLPSGIYLCKLSTGKESRSLKLTLIR